ncbi:MmgE/PrpD family protein [Stutzerimonas kirkiae]|nr:MmgE/PrpD family protein [Stutzerimonas kirkiae]
MPAHPPRSASTTAGQTGDPLDALLDQAAALRYEDLPEAVIAHQKRRLLDNIACQFSGRHAAGAPQLLALLQAQGGVAQATVSGTRQRLPLRDAVMQNALMARAWDFCDVVSPGYHPSSTDVPIALGVGEYRHSSGREVIAALAAGQDVALRINAAAQKTGFFYNGFDANILAPISGAIVAGRLLGLDARQLREAVGLAVNTSAGSFQAIQDRVLAVRLAQAQASRNAVEAALLAAAGFTGIRRVLGGELSFFQLFARREPDWEELRRDLGSEWRGQRETCFKLYPSCGLTLALTDAALQLAIGQDIAASQIVAGRLRVSAPMNLLCGQPFSSGASEIDAMFSLQYVAANALLRRASRLQHFTREAIGARDVVALAGRLTITEEADYQHADQCSLELRLADGRHCAASARFGKGWPENPPDDHDFAAKLRQCLEFAARQQAGAAPTDTERQAEAIGEAVWQLERIADLGQRIPQWLGSRL